MNEHLVKRFMSEISENYQIANKLLVRIKDYIALHQLSKDGLIDFILLTGPIPTREGGEAILEAFRRVNKSEDEKQKLAELRSYWSENFEKIIETISKEGPLR